MAGSGATVRVTGLRELSGAFRKVDADIPKELRDNFRGIAEDVIDDIRPNVPSRSGKARSSLKPRATQKGAGIAFGGNAAPYYPWLDFGGRVGRNRSVERKFVKEGRYVYPGIIAAKDRTQKAVDEAVKDASRKAGFDTEGSL